MYAENPWISIDNDCFTFRCLSKYKWISTKYDTGKCSHIFVLSRPFCVKSSYHNFQFGRGVPWIAEMSLKCKFKSVFLSLILSKNTNIYANTAIKHILTAGCCLNCLDEFEMQICTFPSLWSKRANQQREAEYHNHSHHRRHHIIQECYSICLHNPFESKYVIFSSNRSFLCYYARLEILVHS